MMLPTRILLATNGTEESALAEEAAAGLAASTDAELHLVYVLPKLAVPPTSPAVAHVYSESRLESRRMAGLTFLDERTRNIESATAMEVRSHYREGRAEEQVVGLADEIQADLIVCGDKRRSWIERVFGAGLPRYVKRHSRRPVLAIGERMSEASGQTG